MDILPNDRHANVSGAVAIVIITMGSLRLESHFKGSSALKSLRMADLKFLDFFFLLLIGTKWTQEKMLTFVSCVHPGQCSFPLYELDYKNSVRVFLNEDD